MMFEETTNCSSSYIGWWMGIYIRSCFWVKNKKFGFCCNIFQNMKVLSSGTEFEFPKREEWNNNFGECNAWIIVNNCDWYLFEFVLNLFPFIQLIFLNFLFVQFRCTNCANYTIYFTGFDWNHLLLSTLCLVRG